MTGTVLYLERMLHPPACVVTVQLHEVSRTDAHVALLAEEVIPTAG